MQSLLAKGQSTLDMQEKDWIQGLKELGAKNETARFGMQSVSVNLIEPGRFEDIWIGLEVSCLI